jgi:hypothetical protein
MRVFRLTADLTQPVPGRQELGAVVDYTEIPPTANFRLFALNSLGADGLKIAESLSQRCEADYATVEAYFGVVPQGLPFRVFVKDNVGGAMHETCGDVEIYVGTIDQAAPTHKGYSLLLLAEVVEVLEAAQRRGWNCGANNGEALSRVLANDVYNTSPSPQDLLPDGVTSKNWLDDPTPGGRRRQNWVDNIDPEDTNVFSVGCSVLFLNWLRFELGFSWTQIVAAGASKLAKTYTTLTGRTDGWQRFKEAMDAQYPPGMPSGLKTDNPFDSGRKRAGAALPSATVAPQGSR